MDIKHNAISIKPKHQPRMELQMMERSGDIDRVISAAHWMQPTAETDNRSENQCKDYAYDETDYEDCDSELEEGEIREEESDEQNFINLQEEGNNMVQLEYSTEERAWVQYFPYPDQPAQDPTTHPWLDL